MKEEEPKKKYNPRKLLMYFQTRFFETYNTAYVGNIGRDVKLIKQVNDLFQEHSQLGDVMVFIDLCFKDSPSNPINPIYLKAVVNRKLGNTKGPKAQSKPVVSTEDNTTAQDWAEADQMWNNKLT